MIPSEPRSVIAFRGSLNQYRVLPSSMLMAGAAGRLLCARVQAEVATKGSASYSIKICRKRSPDGSI